MIFEEGVTHLAKQPNPTTFSDDNNPFNYKSNAEPSRTNAGSNENTNAISVHKAIEPLQYDIALQPLATTELHKDDQAKEPKENL